MSAFIRFKADEEQNKERNYGDSYIMTGSTADGKDFLHECFDRCNIAEAAAKVIPADSNIPLNFEGIIEQTDATFYVYASVSMEHSVEKTGVDTAKLTAELHLVTESEDIGWSDCKVSLSDAEQEQLNALPEVQRMAAETIEAGCYKDKTAANEIKVQTAGLEFCIFPDEEYNEICAMTVKDAESGEVIADTGDVHHDEFANVITDFMSCGTDTEALKNSQTASHYLNYVNEEFVQPDTGKDISE